MKYSLGSGKNQFLTRANFCQYLLPHLHFYFAFFNAVVEGWLREGISARRHNLLLLTNIRGLYLTFIRFCVASASTSTSRAFVARRGRVVNATVSQTQRTPFFFLSSRMHTCLYLPKAVVYHRELFSWMIPPEPPPWMIYLSRYMPAFATDKRLSFFFLFFFPVGNQTQQFTTKHPIKSSIIPRLPLKPHPRAWHFCH